MRKLALATLFLLCLSGLTILATQASSRQSTPQVNNQRPDRIRLVKYLLRPIQRVNPIYPPEARAAGIQGLVVLNVVVGVDGSVISVEAKQPSEVSLPAEEIARRGQPTDDPALVQAATDAVKQWKYPPSVFNGEPVEVDFEVNVGFSLGN